MTLIPEIQETNNEALNVPKESFHIAIVGGGPKGMYGLERLAAELAANPVGKKVIVHIFNRTSYFGSGDIYRSDQPDYLKMNVDAKTINMWPEENPSPVVKDTLNFEEWLSHYRVNNPQVPEAGFPGRALVGKYLEAGYRVIKKNLPPGMEVVEYVGEVEDLEKSSDQYQLTYKTVNGRCISDIPYHWILLTTGHPKRKLSVEEDQYPKSSPEAAVGFIPFVYPVQHMLNGVRPASTVGIKGMGLTFVDAVLALTEGRGGNFLVKANKLAYIRSGNEPEKIKAFSRSGLPMIPRNATGGPDEIQLQFFTKERLNYFKEPIDFEQELWPFLIQEMVHAYYRVLFKRYGVDAKEKYESFEELQHDITTYHNYNPSVPPFDIEKFIDPLKGQRIRSGEGFHGFIHRYIKMAINEASLGTGQSPFAAVTAVWRLVTPVFGRYYEFGGLLPSSQEKFNKDFVGALNRLTFGPPIINMKKLVALVDYGILDFGIGPCEAVAFDRLENKFVISSKDYGAAKVDYLLDARIPKGPVRESANGLYGNLLKKGLVKEFTNTAPLSNQSYQPGCLAIDRKGCIIDKKDKVNKQITAYGTPTEGITFDNDSLSPIRNNFVNHWAASIRKTITSNESVSN